MLQQFLTELNQTANPVVASNGVTYQNMEIPDMDYLSNTLFDFSSVLGCEVGTNEIWPDLFV